MADYRSALRARLIGDANVAAVVGTRVYWNDAAQGADHPYIVLTAISDPRPTHLKGRNAARRTRVQCECMALEKKAGGGGNAEAFGLAEKVIAAVEPPGTTAGVKFGFTESEGPLDGSGKVEGVGFVHRAILDLSVHHKLV